MGPGQFPNSKSINALKDDPSELNEVVRQFPFTEDEAFRDSIEGSLFNIGKIYEQIEYNEDLYPNPVVTGNFVWIRAKATSVTAGTITSTLVNH